jgi:heme A synthase
MPWAAVGCTTFPFCAPMPGAPASATAIQITHRSIAVLLSLHLLGMALGPRHKRAGRTVRLAVKVAVSLVLLQIAIAASMVLLHLPPELRSLHEATGVAVWLACYTLAYLTRIAAGSGPLGEGRAVTAPDPQPVAGGAARKMAEVGS